MLGNRYYPDKRGTDKLKVAQVLSDVGVDAGDAYNAIDATFEFKDGRIFRHNDQFKFWRWS
ncbi:MAG: hypothetical protein NZ730_02720 [Porticoccaceae bacterium]|nr:hypothetical protein [Porticoccaceae bacterium]